MSYLKVLKCFLFTLLYLQIISTRIKDKRLNELENKILNHFELYGIKTDQNMLQGFNDNKNTPITYKDTCNPNTCMEPNYCTSNKLCKCVGDYITFNLDDNDNKFCNYQQKRQLTALLLEIIFPIGFGHFYSERVLCGMIKFIVYALVGIYGILVFKRGIPINLKKANGEDFLHFMIASVLICGAFTWHVFDVYMLFTNRYYDGNGISMITFK